jgi:hypothetical protein
MSFDLPKPVRATGPRMPVLIRTTGDAIDAIQALSVDMRKKPHWHNAEELLFRAEESGSAPDLKTAHQALEHALSTEKWLYRPVNG